jgi:hypothetical protein
MTDIEKLDVLRQKAKEYPNFALVELIEFLIEKMSDVEKDSEIQPETDNG